MTQEVIEIQLSEEGARLLTEKIKARAEELWHLLLEAYEGGAHLALGYSSWGKYFEEEFGQHQSYGYRLLDSGRVVKAIEDHSPIGERPNEGQARELAPLAKESPEEAAQVWQEVIEEHGAEATASDVREHVESHTREESDGVEEEKKEPSREEAAKKWQQMMSKALTLGGSIEGYGVEKIARKWPEQDRRVIANTCEDLADTLGRFARALREIGEE